MNNHILTIQLRPNYNLTATKLGFNVDSDDINNEAILFQQGWDIRELEIKPGDKFEISTKYEDGIVSCDDVNYKLIKRNFFGDLEFIEGQDIIVLEPGTYIYHSDGIKIEQLATPENDLIDDDL